MAVTAKWFAHGLDHLFDKQVGWGSGYAVKCALLSSSFTPANNEAHWADVVGYEISGAGYAAVALTTMIRSIGTLTKFTLNADSPIQWTSATFAARYAVFYLDTGNTATSPVLFYIDFGAEQSVTNGTFQITKDASDHWTKLTY